MVTLALLLTLVVVVENFFLFVIFGLDAFYFGTIPIYTTVRPEPGHASVMSRVLMFGVPYDQETDNEKSSPPLYGSIYTSSKTNSSKEIAIADLQARVR